jgi:hypothetical protein
MLVRGLGLPWEDVKPLIVKHLGELEAEVPVVNVFRPGQPVAESGPQCGRLVVTLQAHEVTAKKAYPATLRASRRIASARSRSRSAAKPMRRCGVARPEYVNSDAG